MKRALALLPLTLAVVVGCATNTGVSEVGDGTYLIGGQGYARMTGTVIKSALFKQAAEHCAKSGKKPVIVSDSAQDTVAFRSRPSAEVRFACQ